jgi:putative acetyltransferase
VTTALHVEPVDPRDPEVAALLGALTAELALGGYAPSETFGYTLDQLVDNGVHLVGARAGDRLVGVGGVEIQGGGVGELKRFFVSPEHRGAGAADAVLEALVAHARERGVVDLRLETGDEQHAAMAFYRRHGFAEIPRFGPYVDSATSVCMQRDLGR